MEQIIGMVSPSSKKITRMQLDTLFHQAMHSCSYLHPSSPQPLLHLAVMLDAQEIAQQLLAAGASLHLRNSDNLTPLQLAEDLGNQNMVQLLSKWEYFRGIMLNGRNEDALSQSTPFTPDKKQSFYTDINMLPTNGKMAFFNARTFNSFEDYMDWPDSVRRFHLKVYAVLATA
jgi:ankyrin repeat protein